LLISEITSEQLVSGQFLITENQLRVAKNGNSYLALKLSDGTGELPAKVWDASEELFHSLAVGKVIMVNGLRPRIYQSQIQLDWDSKNNEVYQIVADDLVDFMLFLPKAPGKVEDYWNRLQLIMKGIKEPFLQKVLTIFFEDQKFVTDFLRYPAALKRHHNYLGGLVEHTTGVTTICQAISVYYQPLNVDLLLTGAILHDIGKTKTYQLNAGFEGTNEGKLIGHLVLGISMVERACEQVILEIGLTEENTFLRNSLLHLLVSHHGIMEWGSPIEPLTLEACLLHHADNLDAQATKFLTVIRSQPKGTEWAAYDNGLGRSLYLGSLG